VPQRDLKIKIIFFKLRCCLSEIQCRAASTGMKGGQHLCKSDHRP